MTKIMKYFYLAIKIITFILLLVLVINNIQPVVFKILGLYELKLPLILIVLIFFGIGIIIGRLFGIFHMIELKAKYNNLKKEFEKMKTVNKSGDLN